MLYRLLSILILAIALAACTREADRARPDSSAPAIDTLAVDSTRAVTIDTTEAVPLDQDPVKLAALNTALDTLEAFVEVLERVEGPINAWNQAAGAARLLRWLEQNQAAFAFGELEDMAARRYPAQVARLNELEARREVELKRIGEDQVAARVLVEEMAKADAEAVGR